VYVGAAPRRPRRGGGRGAINHVHVLWVDCDTEDAVAALRRFRPSPPIVVASGTPGHLHAYWPICPPAEPDAAERANRRLAHHLGADPRSTDAARILRPPGTLNHKLDPPARVEAARLHVDVVDVDQVTGALLDPPEPRRRLRRAPTLEPGDDLLAIPPHVYVEALTGQAVGRDGKIACPFHADRTPSLHVYEHPERGWCCFGCGIGGTIIDFGAHLFGIEPRGAGYHELRRRVAEQLLAGVH
jgi:hypothetical protein